MIQKIFLFFMIFSFSITSGFAYELSEKDKNALIQAKELISNFSDKKEIIWFENRVKKIDTLASKFKTNTRYWIIFNELRAEFQSVIDKKLEKEFENTQGEITSELDFFNKYGTQITTGLEVPEKCKTNYDFVDEIAKRNDFPTALIIATWGKETNCNMYNPANGWGPFQITSQYYEPGNIGLIELENSIEKFIAFTRNKWNYFNTNKYHNYKQRFGEENIHLSYDNYTLRDLRLHSVLYNGVSANTTLEGNTFANNNLNPNVVGPSDGIVTRFLKILYWKNTK
ncbi:MAG: hypothetical protein AB7E37_00475 [Candidatus Altimarinota bacterium]